MSKTLLNYIYHEMRMHMIHYEGLIALSICAYSVLVCLYRYTVKPLLTTTPQQRPTLNYDHLFLKQNSFSIRFNGH